MMNLPDVLFGLGCGIAATALAVLLAVSTDDRWMMKAASWTAALGVLIAWVALMSIFQR